MSYRDNVTTLAAKMGISNDPGLREEDLDIAELHFNNSRGDFGTTIKATPMNKGGRLFFQHLAYFPATAAHQERRVVSLELDDIRTKAQEYFAELWEDDPVPGKRVLLDAIRNHLYVEVIILLKKGVLQ